MKFFIICFLSFIKKEKVILYSQNSNTFIGGADNLKIDNLKHNYSGFDERFPINESKNKVEIELVKIQELFEKQNLLDYLQNNKISIYNKLDKIKDNSIQPMHLTAGGLFDEDWIL